MNENVLINKICVIVFVLENQKVNKYGYEKYFYNPNIIIKDLYFIHSTF